MIGRAMSIAFSMALAGCVHSRGAESPIDLTYNYVLIAQGILNNYSLKSGSNNFSHLVKADKWIAGAVIEVAPQGVIIFSRGVDTETVARVTPQRGAPRDYFYIVFYEHISESETTDFLLGKSSKLAKRIIFPLSGAPAIMKDRDGVKVAFVAPRSSDGQ